MLSTLTIISIFTEIFTAGLLLAAGISFVRKFFMENSRKDLYFGIVFLLFFCNVSLAVVSQMMFNLGRSLSELILVHKSISAVSTLCVVGLWFYLISKFKFNQIKWIKYVTWAIEALAVVAIWRIVISSVSLIYRQGVIEPLVDFSHPVPVKTMWILIWLTLAAVSGWRLLS
ncbi:MAG: hypothetical protein WC901_07135, partial [Candidatus Margulisiibacteriota bacterium]